MAGGAWRMVVLWFQENEGRWSTSDEFGRRSELLGGGENDEGRRFFICLCISTSPQPCTLLDTISSAATSILLHIDMYVPVNLILLVRVEEGR
ncbi:unnamed protein product [Urochloa humidicola]